MLQVIDPETVARIVKEITDTEILTRFGTLKSTDIIEKRPGLYGSLLTTADIEAEKRLISELKNAFLVLSRLAKKQLRTIHKR